jgi:hypothetical protein
MTVPQKGRDPEDACLEDNGIHPNVSFFPFPRACPFILIVFPFVSIMCMCI